MQRVLAHGAVLAAVGTMLSLATVRCADVNRGLGDACIRNEDCLSSLCAGSVCVAEPTLFDATVHTDTGVDATTDAAGDAVTDAPVSQDTGTPMDAGKRPSDATLDSARTDAVSRHDAKTDAGEADAKPRDGGHEVGADETGAHDTGTHDASKDVHPAG